jgi:annexin A7/11
MKGFGTDEKKLFSALTNLTVDQMQEVRTAYEAEFKRRLLADVKSETSGYFKHTLQALVQTPAQYDAWLLKEAFSGIGCNKSLISQVLCTRDSNHLLEVKSAYATRFGDGKEGALKARLQSEVSDRALCAVYLHMIEGKRDAGGPAQITTHLTDLTSGHKDSKRFVAALAGHTREHVEAVAEAYLKTNGENFNKLLKKKFSGDLLDAFLLLIKRTVKTFGNRFIQAIDQFDVDEDQVIRIVMGQRTNNLQAINDFVKAESNKNLAQWINAKWGSMGGGKKDAKKVLIATLAQYVTTA